MSIPASPAATVPWTPVFSCAVAAHGVVEAGLADLPALRDDPGVRPGRPIPPRFLRYADEQTVVGLAAVMRASGDLALQGECFDEWGVLAASQFAGRLVGAATFRRFQQGGPATISPHLIPQISLHSPAGAISVALGMHGPNFGVGGGPEALAEGLTAALTFLQYSALPGLWLVLTGWDPEPVPDGMGSTDSPTVCRAVALALVPNAERGWLLRLTGAQPSCATASAGCIPAGFALGRLAEHLVADAKGSPELPWSCDLPWGGRIEMLPCERQQRKAA